ncbi:PREDICTED: uncharacterized protein LOC106125765 [Papilio xuthus]|uniref:non-specific serine/threonine protein kinase n=1 Tax=Papilio xuthus TaxID=66420 RepID=A0AAJ6ZSS5_PAPXU|nr:PREDICTED: uncharacterized protein LOC106125765 [Papilio xuthus]XP_013178547.1 PREDICTED: uncharacterized protein LOC106125765 [Papilio xuthus]
MPRRGNEIETPVTPKKKKVTEECASLDASFFDDEALPPGIVFTDVQSKKWRIGKPIGRGSFGRIYLASSDVDKEVTKQNARFVVKIEPHTNGPLFVEIHCLIRTAQASKVKTWCQEKKLKRLGMPTYIASGSFTEESTGIKYRFLVLPRYDIDLQKIIARTRTLDLKNVLVLSIQILDVLEYLHNQGYTHSDIKSSNLMIGFDSIKVTKANTPKSTQSYQKNTKQVVLVPEKHKKPKTSRSRSSNYYNDDDYIVSQKSPEICNNDKRLVSVKMKLRKILTEKDNKKLHRHHAFNLRHLSNYVNYEDLSSVCSDRSYQKLLDDFSNKSLLCVVETLKDVNKPENKDLELQLDQIYKDAILSQSNGQIYLLDYGLASKFLDSDGNHKDFGMDARKAHDGTLEYSSRDSHIGAHSRRSDLETLGYNMLDWLTGTLPWKTKEVLAEPDLVHAVKKNFMNDIKTLLKTCFKTEFYPQFMEKYLQYIASLDFTEKPDYDYCRNLFKSEMIRNGYAFDKEMNVNFAEPSLSPINRSKLGYTKRFGRKNTPPDFLSRNGIKKTYERENVCSIENGLKLELLKHTLNTSSEGVRKPCSSRNFFISDADLVARLKKSLMPHDLFGKKLSPKNLRSKQKNVTKRKGARRHRNSIGKFGNLMGSARQFTWAEILAGNPEDIIRKDRNPVSNVDVEDDSTCKYRIRKLSNASSTNCDTNLQSPLMQKDYLQGLNPTYAMKEVLANFKKKLSGKCIKEPEECPPGLEGYTPIMIKLHKLKEKREAKEKLELLKQSTENKVLKIEPMCTRSMSKICEPVRRSTRKKPGNGSDAKTSDIENSSEQVPITVKSNDEIKSPRTRSATNKKDVTTANKKSAQTRTKTTTVVLNRRRLRSSKRKKSK